MSKILISMTPEMDNISNLIQNLSTVDTNIPLDAEHIALESAMIKLRKIGESAGGYSAWLKTPKFISEYHEMFGDAELAKLNDEIAKINIHPKMLMFSFHPLCQKKIPVFDKFVGIVIRKQDYDYEHIFNHEKLSKKEADAFFNKTNRYIKKNKNIYDIFIENKSIPEILDILKEL